MDCVQTITNDLGSDIHLDHPNDMKIWPDWMMCIAYKGTRWLIFTNTEQFSNNNWTVLVHLICTSFVHSTSPKNNKQR